MRGRTACTLSHLFGRIYAQLRILPDEVFAVRGRSVRHACRCLRLTRRGRLNCLARSELVHCVQPVKSVAGVEQIAVI